MTTLTTIYQSRIIEGALRADPAQAEAVGVIQVLADRLQGYCPATPGFFSRLFGSGQPAPKGIYLYGDVGRGKSMLMDLFHEQVQVERKRRVHFHKFMLEVHERIHSYQSEGNVDDVLPKLARELANEAWLLCFDEFHVSNIADAMILGRLFTALFAAGIVIFVTTNWPPDDLYSNGLQRDRFLPFIDIIKQNMLIHHLAGAIDYRYECLRGLQNYFTPLGKMTSAKMRAIFAELTGDAPVEAVELPLQGRTLTVANAAKGVASFSFAELCSQPLGAADFLAIAYCFQAVLVDGVPQFNVEQRNEAVRFTTLVDALYEAKVQLFIAAAVPPELLCIAGDHAFTFQRTASRLNEMQSEAYRKQRHLG